MAEERGGKDYIVQLKIKNGPLLRHMRRAGYTSARSFAIACGVQSSRLGEFLNLTEPPINKRGEWVPAVLRMADKLQVMPEDLFPPQHYEKALQRREAEFEVSLDEISNLFYSASDPQKLLEMQDAESAAHTCLDVLTERERKILVARYGLDDGVPQSLREIAERENVHFERIRQIETKAMNKIKVAYYHNKRGLGVKLRHALETFDAGDV